MKRTVLQLSLIIFHVLVLACLAQVPVSKSTSSSMAVELDKTIMVNSKSDSGPGSLREAINNASPGDSITFDPSVFPPGIPDTISLINRLPALLRSNLVIDASNMGVIISGSNIALPEVNGLTVLSSNNVIRGLHLMDFSKAGIAVQGGGQNNMIGGDQNTGEGPLGQGNRMTGEGSFGIFIFGEGTSLNIIHGNVIGTDPEATMVKGSFSAGIFLEGTSNNLLANNLIAGYNDHGVSISYAPEGYNTVSGNLIITDPGGELDLANSTAVGITINNSGFNRVGPSNLIAQNGTGIAVFGKEAKCNHITRNSIHDNRLWGIDLSSGGNIELDSPILGNFDLQTGSLTGWTCSNCVVEIFSDDSDEGIFFEGSTVADSSGFFAFKKEPAFKGPYLTATATDPIGNTSEFSFCTEANMQNFGLQEGNFLIMSPIKPKTSTQLVADNRLQWGISPRAGSIDSVHWLTQYVTNIGAKLVNTTFNEGEGPINWDVSETEIPVKFDQFIDEMNENGVAVNYMIHYWDKIGHAAGEELPNPRFKTDDEIQEFLDYVRHIVGHFKGRVQYYTIWDEPDACGGSPELDVKCIEPLDYIELARQTIPVIREEDPQSKVVTGPVVLFHGREHLFTLVQSDVIQLFDVISTHPMFETAPDQKFFRITGNDTLDSSAEYYYNYPSIVDSILKMAAEQNFHGQYWGQDLSWSVWGVDHPVDQTEWTKHTRTQSAKYHARGVVEHLGMDAGVSSVVNLNIPQFYHLVANLFTILAGTEPANLNVEIESEAPHMVSYGFTKPDGEILLALWTDSAAVNYDPGVSTTLKLSGLSNYGVSGTDVLKGFQQEIVIEEENDQMVIRNLMVKDYPTIISIKPVLVDIPTHSSPITSLLHQNFPNPFYYQTTIGYELTENAQVSLKIYNIFGQLVETLVNEYKTSGYHSVRWKTDTVISGVYFYQLSTGDLLETKNCLILK